MALPNKNFATFVADMVTAWATQMGLQPVFQSGDPLLAMMQAVAGQLVFIQAEIQIVNAVARAQTSSGGDLDTFYGQFGFTRLPGTSAVGPITLSKLTPATSQVLVLPGVIIQTPGGAIQYQVIADTNQPAYSTLLGGYVLPIGQTSISVTAQASQSGSAFNVSANQLSQIATSIAGIDLATNPQPISNGTDAEPDASFSSRFVLWLNSLSKAIKAAIESAIQGVQQGIEYSLQENVDVAGRPRLGEFVAVIDDGTGSPPASLVAAVQQAIEAVRGFTILAEAEAVAVVIGTIFLAVRVAAEFSAVAVTAAVADAVAAMVDALPIGATLFVSSIERAALAVQGVVSIQPGATRINSLPTDLSVTLFQAIRSGTGNIMVGTY